MSVSERSVAAGGRAGHLAELALGAGQDLSLSASDLRDTAERLWPQDPWALIVEAREVVRCCALRQPTALELIVALGLLDAALSMQAARDYEDRNGRSRVSSESDISDDTDE